MQDFVHRPLSREENWVSAYEAFVESLKDGYPMDIYEYTNDISHRQMIEENKSHPTIVKMRARIEAADARLKALLLPTKRCIHGDYPRSCFWYWGYPPHSPELEQDLRTMGAI